MTDELLLSIAFPGDTYYKVQEDIELLLEKDLDDESMLNRHVVEFYLYVLLRIIPLDYKVIKVFKNFFGPNVNLISSQSFAEFFFNEYSIDAVLDFLNKYDKEYFWGAFGISLENGDAFYKKMCYLEENPDVLSEIHREIINSRNLKKDILVNELSYPILCRNDHSEEEIEAYAGLALGIYELAFKYPSIIEALSMVYENVDNAFDIFTSLQLLKEYQDESKSDFTPQALFEIIKSTFIIGNFVAGLEIIHGWLTDENKLIRKLVLNSFQIHRYGYEVYLYYSSWCKHQKKEPAFYVDNNSKCYFYNSYKVPQIDSLSWLYFSELSEEDAKEKTKKCFEKIYESLKNEGFLDEGCRKEEFLWAFGLTDEYPFAFRKIKFYTLTGKSKRDKGNGAFLCLLTILGYTSEEIKAMLHRNPEKSIINKTFDLTIKDNTIMSKDYDELLKIVKSSGLPI